MPSPRVLDLSPKPNESLRNIFGSTAEHAYNRNQENQDIDILSSIEGYNEPQDAMVKLNLLEKQRGLSPQAKIAERQKIFENAKFLQEQNKFNKEQDRADRKLELEEKKINKDRDRKTGLVQAYANQTEDLSPEIIESMSPKDLQAYINNKNKPEPKVAKTPEDLGKEAYYKAQGKEASDAVTAAKKKLTEVKGNRDTIDELKNLNKKLKGPGGYLKILYGSKEASEFNALGHSLVKVPLSIFNPTGPVGVRKLEQLKEIYAITASERYGTIEGKLKAAEWMNELSENAAKAQLKLYEDYNGFPPKEELEKFNRDFERAVIDPALEQSFQEGAEQMVGGFYSPDGRPLKPMPKSKAADLLEKGLITHEPPK